MIDPSDLKSCSSCGASIVFAITLGGKKIPVDVVGGQLRFKEYPDGNIAIQQFGHTWEPPKWQARVIAPDGWEAHPPSLHIGGRYKSHFATCPNAASHRKS